MIATNPAKNDDRDHPLELPYERPTMHYLNREDALAYLDACEAWYRPLAEVLLGAGLRIGEAIALEWRDVDWDGIGARDLALGEGQRQGRHAEGRPLPDCAARSLPARAPARAPEGPGERSGLDKLVFRSPEGFMLNRHNVRRRGHDHALKDAGLPDIRLHDLRHTAATLWLAPASRSTSSSSSSATPTSRRRSTSTGTPTSRPTGKPPRGPPPGGEKRLRIALGTAAGTRAKAEPGPACSTRLPKRSPAIWRQPLDRSVVNRVQGWDLRVKAVPPLWSI